MHQDGSFLIYKSSAGSGKTYTLTLAYLKIILSNRNPDYFKNILAITFTNKAANEMKERIVDTLHSISKGTADSAIVESIKTYTTNSEEEIKERAANCLKEIIHNYGKFSVMTIDKFTHSLIRGFSRELGLSSNFNLETDKNAYYYQAVRKLLNDIGEDEDLTKAAMDYANFLIEQEENKNIEQSIVTQINELKSEEHELKMVPHADATIAYFYNKTESYKVEIKKVFKEYKKRIAEILDKYPSQLLDLLKGPSSKSTSMLKLLEGVLDFTDFKITPATSKHITNGEFTSKARIKSNPELATFLEENSEDLQQDFLYLIETFEYLKIAIQTIKNISIFSFINSAYQYIDDIKKNNNTIFIGDFNLLISDIISKESAPFIYEKIGSRYKHFFIDEFQDTSTLQWQNIIPLLHDSLSTGYTNLIVGDAKQSIYRWRGGNSEQFLSLPNINLPVKDEVFINQNFSRNGQVLNLDNNYRSAKEVVNFNNSVFSKLGAEEILNDPVSDTYKDVVQNSIKDFKGYVEVNIYDKKITALSKEDFAKENFLNQIKSLINKGYPLKEIAILVRTKKHGIRVANWLSEENIPTQSADSLIVGASKHVKFIGALLKVFEQNTAQNNWLVAEYYPLKSAAKLISQYSNGRNEEAFLTNFLEGELDEFNQKSFLSLGLLDRVNYILSAFNINRTDPYVDKFLNILHNYINKHGSGIGGFIKSFYESSIKEPVDVGKSISAVKIMTIHKSKGLQFRAVVIPFDFYSQNDKFEWSSENYLRDLGIKSMFIKKGSDPHKVSNDRMTQLDIYNLYYVAFTRAEEKLFINFTQNRSEAKEFQVIISNIEGFNAEKKTLKIGEFTDYKPFEKQKESIEEVTYDQSPYLDWKDHLTLHLTADSEDTIDERIQGDIIHQLINDTDDYDALIPNADQYFSTKPLHNSFKNGVISRLKSFVQNEEIRAFLSEGHTILKERSITMEDDKRKTLRPDFISIKNHEVSVIDFKTGEPSKKHKKQVVQYEEALRNQFELPVRSYLIYLHPEKTSLIHV